MATGLQKLARDRNWLKFRLMGVTVPQGPWTESEEESLNIILEEVSKLKKNFNKGSEEWGLKVKPRCWCGKTLNKSRVKYNLNACCDDHERS